MSLAAALGPLCAFGCAVTWALGASHYSALSREHSPFAINLMRALFGFPFFLLTAFVIAGGAGAGLDSFRAIEGRHAGWFLLSMICSYGLGDACFMWASRSLGAPGAMAIASIYPLWTTAIGYARGERLSALQLGGVLLTVLGVVVVILSSSRSSERGVPHRRVVTGVSLALITSAFWATNVFAVSLLGQELAMPVANSVRMAVAIFMSAGLGWLVARDRPILLPGATVRRMSGIFILESFVGSAFFLYGVSHSPLAIGSTLASLAPAVAVPVAVILGLERFVAMRAAGICVVVLGLAMMVAG